MDLLVSDTSVLVDLKRGSLLEAAFGLPYRFVVPDLLYERELREHGGDELVELGLVVSHLTGEQVELAQAYKREKPALSSPDVFALALAKTEGGTLLTGDKRLRSLAVEKRIACHGLLWLFDEMHLEGTAAAALVAGLQAIRAHPRCRLPPRESTKDWQHMRCDSRSDLRCSSSLTFTLCRSFAGALNFLDGADVVAGRDVRLSDGTSPPPTQHV